MARAKKKATERKATAKKKPSRKRAAKKTTKRRTRKDGRPGSGRPGGRPTKCTPRRIARLCHALRLSLTLERACRYASMSKDAFDLWRNRAEAALESLGLDPEVDLPVAPDVDEDGKLLPDTELEELLEIAPEKERPYVGFLVAATRALEEAEVNLAEIALTGAMNEAASRNGGSKSAIAILERRYPKTWGLTQKHEHSGKDGGAILPYKFRMPEEEA